MNTITTASIILAVVVGASIFFLNNNNNDANATPETDEIIQDLLNFPPADIIKSRGETPCYDYSDAANHDCTVSRETVLREGIKAIENLEQSESAIAESAKRYLVYQLKAALFSLEHQ